MQKIEENFSFIEDIILLYLYVSCGSAGKESTCNMGDLGSISGLGRSPGEGNISWRRKQLPTPIF